MLSFYFFRLQKIHEIPTEYDVIGLTSIMRNDFGVLCHSYATKDDLEGS